MGSAHHKQDIRVIWMDRPDDSKPSQLKEAWVPHTPFMRVRDVVNQLPPDFLPPKPDAFSLAVFGQMVSLETVLTPGDRLEILRDLRIDPKVARRHRAQRKRLQEK